MDTDDRSIRIYACLNALKGENSDVLAPLAYFFEEYFFISHGRVFSQSSLVTFARNALGWSITEDIAEDFIPHFQKMGWLERKGTEAQAFFVINHERPSQNNSDPTIDLVNKLRAALTGFLRGNAGSLVVKQNDDDLLDKFLRWLMNLKGDSSGPDRTVTEGEPADLLPDESQSADTKVGTLDYFFARFVEETVDTDPVLASSIPNLWAVGMLLEVADEITRPAALSQNSDLRIVIDAPVALNYLGLAGKKSQQGIALVLDSLKAIGCRIGAFDISCQEMNRALSSLLKNNPADRYGRTADALRSKEVSIDRVEHVRSHPDTALAEAGVEILPYKLESTKSIERHFSEELYEDYLGSIGWGDTADAKIHDATAFALTMRLRHGQHSSDFFRNKFVFITQNEHFSRSSRKYALRAQVLNEHHVPPVFSTKRLATIAWLQTGLSVAGTDIPKGILVNVCARITSTKRNVLEQARDDIASLTAEEQEEYLALATHPRSTRVMMDYYESRPSVLDGANPTELLAKMESALAEEHERRAASAVAEAEAVATEKLARAAEESASLNAEAQAYRGQADAYLASICDAQVADANWLSFATRCALIGVFSTVSVALLFAPLELDNTIKIPLILLTAALAVASTYFTIFSNTGPSLNRLIAQFWARRVRRKLLSRGVTQEAADVFVEENGTIRWRKS